ncbi:hypothetical protein [Mycobacterium sp. IDR2000157661]|uniref:hypothetical protein n=1 Tax=Mycobacterium sp. IDR2000157661 TaxID=2867005 RepID=UPI001EEBEF9B|nr:hypothetical protein [Mycobacterium sp. IDR2000157661]ULE32025.1 hypothetical protein K3G64_17925 [Mycobacterium sp. IDR2000157661]
MPGDLTPQLINTDVWADDMVAAAGIPIVDVPFVTVGGGIGSFVTFDTLRIYGVPASAIAVLGPEAIPWASYEYLTRVSQIPRNERIRSDSSSTPDNIWGFPSYAVREAFSAKSLSGFLTPLWGVLVEPIFANYYTPTAGQVFESLEREYNRVGYAQSVHLGDVRMTRRRNGGGYFTILTPPPGSSPTKRVAFRSMYVHIAIGYPGLQMLPELQEFRVRYQDPSKVVIAYEPHEHVYQSLQRRPGTVMIRGSGIVASRVLQRLIDDRDRYGLQTTILHLFRTYVASSHGSGIFMRRKGAHGWAHQGFNYPKSVWGGQLKAKMRKLEGEARARAYDEMGGTNTPVRKSWQNQLHRGRSQGWYQVMAGSARNLRPTHDHQGLTATIVPDHRQPLPFRSPTHPFDVTVNFVIDCTGLEADIREHRVLADLLDHSGAGRNPKGRLDVDTTFELIGTRSGEGRMYASGTATLGGYFPGVDTFLGLQIAAQEIADDLAANGFCPRMGPLRSMSQWVSWARNSRI